MKFKTFKSKAIKTLAVTALLLASLAGCGSSAGNAGSSAESDLFRTMKTVDLEGNEFDSTVFAENKLTMVNVWNIGCTPCIMEIPELEKLDKDLEDFSVLGLYHSFAVGIPEDEKAEIKTILSDAKATYPQLEMSKDMLNSDEIKNLTAFPTTYFVDAEGNIVEKVEGSNDYEGWKEVIKNVMEKVDANA